MPRLPLLPVLRLLLGTLAFLFVAQQLPFLSLFHWFPDNLFFYITLPSLALAVAAVTWRRSPTLGAMVPSLLISFLPVALILSFGFTFSREFHYLAYFAVGCYTMSAFASLATRLVRRERKERGERATSLTLLAPLSLSDRKHRPELFLVTMLTLAFFFFGLHDLTRFAAVDEPLWLDGRIGKFWKHLSEQAMDKTLVSDKPGITVTLLTGPGLLVAEPKNYRDTRYEFEAKHPGTTIEDLYLAFRLPLLIAITLLLPFFYILLVPLVGTSAALFGYSAITLSPILIGMSKIVNPDSLLFVFAPLSLLAYLVFLEKRVWRYLFFSGVFLGLALLTKYVANILIVYFFALSFLYPLWKRDEPLSLNFLFQVFLLWLGTGLATLYLFVPAFWIDPSLLLSSTLLSQAFEKVAFLFITLIFLAFVDQVFLQGRRSTALLEALKRKSELIGKLLLGTSALIFGFVLLNGLLGMPWIDFGEVLASPKNSKLHGLVFVYLSNFYPLVFGSVPLVLLGMGTLLWRSWRTMGRMQSSLERLTLAILFFILLYSLGSTINGVALINRYQIMLYPLFALLGGIGLSLLLAPLIAKIKLSPLSPALNHLSVVIVSLALALSPLLTPFPLSYASILLPKQFTIDLKDMGAGSYEAAEYLNQLPNARETAIWTDKSGVCKFYVGPCIDGFNLARLKAHSVRYLVLSSGRESRTQNRFVPKPDLIDKEGEPILLNTYYQRHDPLHEIKINGRSDQTVKIFPLNL